VTRRDPWAILYASLGFGGIAIPYCYFALQVTVSLLISFPISFRLTRLFLLGASTALLLLVFVARTRLEQRLSQTLGRYFPRLLAVLVVAAVGYLIAVTLALMNPFPLMLPVQSWADFITIAAVSALVAAVLVIVRPPSRLERAIASRLDRRNRRHRAYRAVGYAALTSGLLFASYWIYQDYLYGRYCSDAEQQDYIDCQFLH
jgi:hypothetical protein